MASRQPPPRRGRPPVNRPGPDQAPTSPTRPQPPPPSIGERLSFLGRRRGAVFLCAILAGAGAVGVSYLQTPVYEATGSVVFKVVKPTAVTVKPDNAVDRFVRTQVKVMQSEPVRAKVRKALGTDVDVAVEVVPGADALEVTGRSSDPEGSADIANSYINSFIEYRREVAVDEVLESRDKFRTQVSAIEAQLSTVPADQRPAVDAELAKLRNRLVELEREAVQEADPDVVEAAEVPDSPVSPQPLRTGALALLAGLALGVGVAAIGEAFDDSVKSPGDFGRTVPEVPVVGRIPAVPEWRVKEEALTICLSDPAAPAAEAFRTLRTRIMHERRGPGPSGPRSGKPTAFRSIQVTSAGASEGKTTTAANLAVAFAAAGQRVVLVGCDLRRPRVHEFFDLSNDIGFTSVLLGKVPLSRALQEVERQPRLFVLASGPLPPNPSELLASRRTAEVLASLSADADILVIDSPPLLSVTDALVLADSVDATLLVSVVCSTTRKELRQAADLLASIDAPLIGAVLNGVSPDDI